ncbi:N-acetylgalactosamine-6-sulfatase-like [Dysidea avara]|uniref:N-acetylgalactosamine-6-sulfatase-like n=1 Tax=Dysidea avara TaxID=196820 RepID=UPI00331B8036
MAKVFRLLLCVLLLIVSEATGEDRPNIIFAMADDLGWGDVQYNNGKAATPNLNEMAHSPNTILLQRYYSGGPVCSPTRGTVLTGRNHNRYCVWSANAGGNTADFVRPETMPLPLSEITVAEVMRQAGYSTAMFGKWHLGDFKKLEKGNEKWPISHPGMHGFDEWWSTERSAGSCTINCGCFSIATCVNGHYKEPPTCTNYYTYTNNSGDLEEWPDAIPGDDTHFLFTLAEKYIREQAKSQKPFFLYLPFHTVHIRYIATDEMREKYLKQNYTEEQADYFGAITAMDEVIGELRSLLKELRIKDNTLFWFASDNGALHNSPGSVNGLRGYKTLLYEGGVRVPGMIEWPDVISSNKVSWFPVISSDLLPTVRDILGVKPSDDRPIDGISILPFLQGKMDHRNHSIYWGYDIHGNFNGKYNMSTSGDQYKLMATYENGKVLRHYLYDLLNDLGETTDLKDKLPTIANKLLNQIEEWRKSVMESVDKVGCLGTGDISYFNN